MSTLKLGYLGLIAALCAASYFWGRADGDACQISTQIKKHQHVQQQTARIYARPNARRDALLELMRQGKL